MVLRPDLVVGKQPEKEGMGQFGRITSLEDLPSDKVLLGYIRKAAELNAAGIKNPSRPRARPGEKRELAVPIYFVAALKKNRKAQTNFENFSYSHKKEYVEWLTGAKREETRQRRLATALGWIAAGKWSFAIALILMIVSMAISLRELQISVGALDLLLSELEEGEGK